MASDGTRKITRTKNGKRYEYWEARATIDGRQRSFTAATQREAKAK
jgi:hypothetical protein